MDLFQLTKDFWRIRRGTRITSSQADLYFFLLYEANERRWPESFEVTNKLIVASIDISEPTLIECRKRLKEIGLIDFENGQKNFKSPVYSLNNLSNPLSKTRVESGTNPLVTSLTDPLAESGTDPLAESLTLNKTKPDNNKPTKKNDFVLNFHGFDRSKSLIRANNDRFPEDIFDLFQKKWDELLTLDKWKSKSPVQLQAVLDQLEPYSRLFITANFIVREIMTDAIAKGWGGLIFEDINKRMENFFEKHGNSGYNDAIKVINSPAGNEVVNGNPIAKRLSPTLP